MAEPRSTSEGDLEILWQDGERVYCRMWRDGDGGRRELLAVLPSSAQPTPGMIDRLAHEHGLKDHLEPAWAVRPLELVRDRGRSMLVLEATRGRPLDPGMDRPLEVERFLRLAVAVTAALGGLHERGLVHRDIKPSNVLVDASTGDVRLTGFGIASLLPRERQAPRPPEFIAGTLSHMSPEQTGRMNRSIDSRSDLYSLGVTLYQALTGSLPFAATDPMEWVHCHIARKPQPLRAHRGDIAVQVSAIVMKLLAKTPEERYQTAAGVEHDLRRCLHDWKTRGAIDAFPLGESDMPDRLLMPERLYGREKEIATLLAAFDRLVTSGASGLVLVSGHAGIGKSSVVSELHKVLVPPRGLFASGKFDRLTRDIPYAAPVQALQSLVRNLLGKPEAELNRWRNELRRVLDPNAALMVDLIPELRFVMGEQPPLPEVPPPAAQARLHLAFRGLIGVFARPEHPLALFLDDLQWLDGATVDLLGDLLIDPELGHLLLVGAYRDSEVDPTHPLMRKVSVLRGAGAIVNELDLAPLAQADVSQWTADALRCEPRAAAPLAELVHDKTGGNPFFVGQFLQRLVDEGSIHFDSVHARWRWDLPPIQAKGYTDNVVDMMVGKLSRLSPGTQEAITELACLGNMAQGSWLAMVHGTSEEQLQADLWEALRLGLVVRAEGAYRFGHDRVQEAAYCLIPEAERPRAHLRIGRLLVAHLPDGPREEAVFEIVAQLNRGSAAMDLPEEREQLAELNLNAGKRAKTAAAYPTALHHLSTGAALVGPGGWERRHDLVFELELHRGECEFLSGEMTLAEERLNELSSRALSGLERAAVACLRADVYVALQQIDRSVAVCLECLAKAGLDLPVLPTDEQGRAAYDRVWSMLGDRSIEELTELPLMTDPTARAVLDVLAKIVRCAFTKLDRNLLTLVLGAAVELSLQHGHCDSSCSVYEYFGVVAGWEFGDFEAGYRFGRLGQELVERKGLRQFEALVCLSLGILVMPWAKPIAASRPLIRSAFDLANKSGDRISAVSSCCTLVSNLLLAGEPLLAVEQEAEAGLAFCRRSAFRDFIDAADTQAAFIRNLRGKTRRFGVLDDDSFDERRLEDHFASQPHAPVFECWYWIRRLQARLLAGDFPAAMEASRRAKVLLWSSPALIEVAEYELFSALTHAALCDLAPVDERAQHLEELAAHGRELDRFTLCCPENFQNGSALVAAELARLEGRDAEAMRLYERAIRSARESGFVHREALSAELAAHFYAAGGFDAIAATYFRNACYGYRRWGAEGKVRQLEERHPQLREEDSNADPTRTVQTPLDHLDLTTVVKVLRAVSGEIDLEKLIATMMRLALEHAGAERGLIILPRGDAYRIEAEAKVSTDGVTVALRRSEISAADMPQSALQYVLRTKESLLLRDAAADRSFSGDEYVRRHRTRSLLCMPLLKQTSVRGVIYLENNLSPGVFTPARMALLELLASDAAISLENACLYRDLKEREARVRRLVDANIIGIVMWHFDGRIIDTNEAFLRIVGHDRKDLVSGRVRWGDLTPPEWRDHEARVTDDLRATGAVQAHEREYLRKDGSRVPVLAGVAMFDDAPDQGLAFVLDLTEIKRAEQAARDGERRYHELEMRLADANRAASMGHLSACIAHEVNQPLAGIVINASTCVRLLAGSPANSEAASEAARRIIRDGDRAASVIARLRALFAKQGASTEPVDLNEATREVLTLSSNELQKNRVLLRPELAPDLPPVMGDRIQLQQVILNLLLNASQAMTTIQDRPRDLVVRTERDAGDAVRLTVRDSGVGLPPDGTESIFQAFYTTKKNGMGVGLSVSRSIVESHGGWLSAAPNADGPGASFSFVVRTSAEQGSRRSEG